jgi:hypothetical protein
VGHCSSEELGPTEPVGFLETSATLGGRPEAWGQLEEQLVCTLVALGQGAVIRLDVSISRDSPTDVLTSAIGAGGAWGGAWYAGGAGAEGCCWKCQLCE